MARFEFLGRLSDQLESPQELSFPSEVTTIAQLRPWLNEHLQCGLFSESSVRAIVNEKMAGETAAILDTDTIVFYPPVGGG